MSDKIAFYKIRNSAGKYSTGGSEPRFTKGGKAWNTMAHLKAHLAQLYAKHAYTGCSVVTFTVAEADVSPVASLVKSVENDKKTKQAKRAESSRRALEAAERKQLATLQEKYK